MFRDVQSPKKIIRDYPNFISFSTLDLPGNVFRYVEDIKENQRNGEKCKKITLIHDFTPCKVAFLKHSFHYNNKTYKRSVSVH